MALTVFVQSRSGTDLIRAAVHDGRGVFCEGPPSLGVMDLSRQVGRLSVLFPELRLHPEEQVDVGRQLVQLSLDIDVVIATNSLTMLYVINNVILAANHKSVAAYDLSDGLVNLCSVDNFIDERPLGEVNDKLQMELNRIVMLSGPPSN